MSKSLSQNIFKNKQKLAQAAQQEFEGRAKEFLQKVAELTKEYEVKMMPVIQKYGLDIEVVNIKEQNNENQTQK